MLPSYVCPSFLGLSDLNWIHVQDAEEAWKLLKVGRKNQSFASTHLNQNSSRRLVGYESAFHCVPGNISPPPGHRRYAVTFLSFLTSSHSIFSVRILHLQGEGDIIPKISE